MTMYYIEKHQKHIKEHVLMSVTLKASEIPHQSNNKLSITYKRSCMTVICVLIPRGASPW